MKQIFKPSIEARKEILKIYRGYYTSNTIVIDPFTGNVLSFLYYRSDKGEWLSGGKRYEYVFHINKSNPFISYVEIDEEIEYQYKNMLYQIENDIKLLSSELERDIEFWETEKEYNDRIKEANRLLEQIN